MKNKKEQEKRVDGTAVSAPGSAAEHAPYMPIPPLSSLSAAPFAIR
jgi:hypothetical protein